MNSEDILNFWFDELSSENWFSQNDEIDKTISLRFGSYYQGAVAGELYTWRQSVRGRLAEIIVLDQFARNLFRGDGRAFAGDSIALVLAQEAVNLALDQQLPAIERAFLYMPYMHSESLVIHEQAIQLFDQPGLENNLDFELQHKAIIDRFGRYPHRNSLLGRESTPAERAFLEDPGSSF